MWQVDTHEEVALGDWSCCAAPPGGAAALAGLPTAAWFPAPVPGTAASALRAAGAAAGPTPSRLDGVDWWYRCRFQAIPPAAGRRLMLCFDGLATVTDVWLNGEAILHAESMFVGHGVDVTARLRADNELVLRFAALDSLLAARRPRPRWRAPMIEHQQLRWFRTTLLGRTPGWSPALAPVGPWRPVRLQTRSRLDVLDVDLRATLRERDGLITVAATLQALDGRAITAARLVVTGPTGQTTESPLSCQPDSQAAAQWLVRVSGAVTVGDAARWWPHTHGAQPRYGVRLVVAGEGGDVTDVTDVTVDLGRVGFRTVALETKGGDFALSVNGVPVFCRGACWTPLDAATLTGPPDEYRRTLRAARDAGMNMLRVAGPMVYENDVFHELCDELGILIWQDFMFANMDYPEDPRFVAEVEAEVGQALARWQGRPSIAVLCGDSEGEQQAAMWGAPSAAWHRPLFRETLARLCLRLRPDVPYWPSSASGGDFPHQPRVGSTSYYGVGAYLRPLEDARRSEVRFASECLGFANVPGDAILAQLAPGGSPRVHSPAWKAGVPRDLGAGWDFDDVRDFYLKLLFGVDPTALRSSDPERYLALSRITTGEVMEAAFAEWRRAQSSCRGALIWFLRDLVAGAGWGVLDASGDAKAVYHYVRRILRPVAVFFSDEGLNGAFVHAVNERETPWEGALRLKLFRDGETQVAAVERAFTIPARGGEELAACALLGGFADTTYAYRFGPPEHDLAVATLVSPDGGVASEAFFFPTGRPANREGDLGMEATVAPRGDGRFVLAVRSRRFAQAVAVQVDGFTCDDNFFHVQPGGLREVILVQASDAARPRGTVQATNARGATRISIGG